MARKETTTRIGSGVSQRQERTAGIDRQLASRPYQQDGYIERYVAMLISGLRAVQNHAIHCPAAPHDISRPVVRYNDESQGSSTGRRWPPPQERNRQKMKGQAIA